MILSLLISLAFAAEPSKAPVFGALEKAPANQPLGGSFSEGEKLLRAGDPENEANIVFNERGVATITVCGFACVAPGIDSKESAQEVSVPATGDALDASNKGYNEAATDFATRFNKQMIARKSPKQKGEWPIYKELSTKQLTVNGVVIGKSNLYNPVGFFGANMFKKQGDGLAIICWKGDDGTTIAFESGASGGRDQTITGARLLASGVDYKYAADCKSSKKVSSKLELVGVKLGDSAGETEKKLGAPSDRGTDRMMWHYLVESKKKNVKSDIEIAAPGEKVNSISVDRVETH